MNQIGGQGRQSIVLAMRPTVFDRDILALGITGFIQALPEGSQPKVVGRRGSDAEIANYGHQLLRASANRARDCGSRDQDHEVATPHSDDLVAEVIRALTIDNLT
jgi:hypothetical protein